MTTWRATLLPSTRTWRPRRRSNASTGVKWRRVEPGQSYDPVSLMRAQTTRSASAPNVAFGAPGGEQSGGGGSGGWWLAAGAAAGALTAVVVAALVWQRRRQRDGEKASRQQAPNEGVVESAEDRV